MGTPGLVARLLPMLCVPIGCFAQIAADRDLLTAINRIRAIDNHSHPAPMLREEDADTELDPVAVDQFECFPLPLRLRPDNVQYVSAWRALYGYPYKDMTEVHRRELREAKLRIMREKGDQYPAWVLDRML